MERNSMANSNAKENVKFSIFSEYRSFLMGVAILSIIMFHYTEDCSLADYHFGTCGWRYLYYTYIASAGVDLFLLLSGLGCWYSFSQNSEVKLFYKKRMLRILPDYILVALPSWVVYDLIYEKTSLWQFVKDFTFLSFFDGSNRWFWYILVSCVCYLIFPWIFRFFNETEKETEEHIRLLMLWVVITLAAILLYLQKDDLYSAVNIALLRIPYFVLGVWLGKNSMEERPVPAGWIWFGILSLAGIEKFATANSLIARYYKGFSFTVFCFGLIVLLERIEKYRIIGFLKRIVEWFGAHSLELYLVHVALRRILKGVHLNPCHPRYEALLLVLTLAIVSAYSRLRHKS